MSLNDFFIYIFSFAICLACRKMIFSNIITKVKHIIGFVPIFNKDGLNPRAMLANMLLIFAFLPFVNMVCAIMIGVFSLFYNIGNSNNNFLNKDI